MAKYFICRRDEEAGMAVEEVEGEDVTIPGYEEFPFFLHPSVNSKPGDDLWAVTERTTGYAVAKQVWGRDNAVIVAQLECEKYTKEQVRGMQEKAYGQQPLEIRERLGNLPQEAQP